MGGGFTFSIFLFYIQCSRGVRKDSHLQTEEGRLRHQRRKNLQRLLHAVRAGGRFNHKLAKGLHETPRRGSIAAGHGILARPH